MFNVENKRGRQLTVQNNYRKMRRVVLEEFHSEDNVHEDFVKREKELFDIARSYAKDYMYLYAFSVDITKDAARVTKELRQEKKELIEELDSVQKENEYMVKYICELEDELSKFKREKQVSIEVQNKIKEMSESGISYSNISKEVGYSKKTISLIVNNKY